MIRRPNFSVVMAVYSGDKLDFFKSSLNSILNQSLTPDEILISIDGPISSDLESYLINFECSLPLVLVRSNYNNGPGFARHSAIIKSNCEIIAIMDSDDISDSSRFELQVKEMIENDLDVVGSYINEFDFTLGDSISLRTVPLRHSDIFNYCKWRCPMNHVTVMFKKDTYLRAGGYPFTRVAEDHELFYRMLKSGARFGNLDSILVHVRRDSHLLTRRKGYKYFISEMRFINLMYKEGFLTSNQFFLNLSLRLMARLSPQFFLGILYKFLLRATK